MTRGEAIAELAFLKREVPALDCDDEQKERYIQAIETARNELAKHYTRYNNETRCVFESMKGSPPRCVYCRDGRCYGQVECVYQR